jgi:hypothetical protein
MSNAMDDRALLEMAARAARIALGDFDAEAAHSGIVCGAFELGEDTMWNPLASDADAFGLMVKLGLLVLTVRGFAVANHDSFPLIGGAVRLDVGDDEYAATRRAIVIAAARIGKQMSVKGTS